MLFIFFFLLVLHFRSVEQVNREKDLYNGTSLEVEGVLNLVDKKYSNYSNLLDGARGFISLYGDPNRDDWKKFTDSLELDKHQSITAMAFVKRVSNPDKEKYINFVKADDSLAEEEIPNFTVWPNQDSDEYYVVQYLEPFEPNKGAIGFDLLSDETRKKQLNGQEIQTLFQLQAR